MDKPDVRVVEFDPMRVATCHRFGEHAATLALETLIAWASARNLLTKRHIWKPAPRSEASHPRFFGFSDPLPVDDDPTHGFEAWMTVGDDASGDDVSGDGAVSVQQVPGGLYAVTRATPEEFAGGAAWERFESRLDPWMEENHYQYDDTRQWLEAYIPAPHQIARLPELGDESRWIAFDLCIPIEPVAESGAAQTRRKNSLRNLVALVLTVAVFAFASGTFAGLEARRGPDWYLELQAYVAESAPPSETTTIVSIVEATEPTNFRTGMGTARHDSWRRVPAHAAKCVLIDRSRPLTPGSEPVSQRQVVFLVYHSDALYQVGWLAYAGPREPFGQEVRAHLRAVGCDLELE